MYDRIKGFADVYPAEMAAHREVIDTVEAVARGHGFREINTPRLEPAAMWTDKAGEDIVEELYAFEDRGGRQVTLTPELTPTVARMVAQRGQALSKPIKWFSTRPFWRYEEPQQGRYREFYQTNVDIFGSAAPEADAEILTVAIEMLTELGLTAADVEFRVSHRDVLAEVLRTFDADVDVRAAIRAVDKSAKIDRDRYLGLLTAAGLSDAQAVEFADLIAAADDEAELDELTAFSDRDRLHDAVENLRATLAAVADFGVREYCTVSLTTARGFDYYTGVVFECFDAAGEVSRSVFGGGRYDDLIESFGGAPTPAVGVAPGVMNSTLPLLLQRAGVWPEEAITTDYYVLRAGDTHAEAAAVARELRALGHVVETDVAGRSFGDQLGYADGINAETVVIVGERDLAEDQYTLRDMATGEQTTVPVDEFPPAEGRPTVADY